MESAADSIGRRVVRFLQRKIAILEEMNAEVQALEEDLTDECLDHWRAIQLRYESTVAQLAEEHVVLLREWRASSSAPDTLRGDVSMLSEEAESLSAALVRRYEHVIQKVSAQQRDCTQQLEQLRQGKSLVHRYLPRIEPDSGSLDKSF